MLHTMYVHKLRDYKYTAGTERMDGMCARIERTVADKSNDEFVVEHHMGIVVCREKH